MEDKSESAPPSRSDSFLARHDFLLRRLHSLSGLIPVGAYMVVHLATNATVLNGAGTFQNQVDTIHALGIALPVIEWTFIFIPLLFHAIFGFVIIRSGKSNASSYPLPNNIRYTLQRVSGMVAAVFILYHVLSLHWLGRPLGGGNFDPEFATSTAAMAIGANLFVQIFYVIGILACVFHLANGLWTMGITWGVWTSPAAMKRADYVCAAFGASLAVVGLAALFGMTTVDVADARAIEQARHEERLEREQRIEELRQRLEADSEVSSATQAQGAAPAMVGD